MRLASRFTARPRSTTPGWRDPGRYPREPSAQGAPSGTRPGRSREARKSSGRIRMAVIPDFKMTTMNSFIRQNISPGSTIYTDGLKSFTGLPESGYPHVPRTQPLRTELRQGAKSAVPLADRAIGNVSLGHGQARVCPADHTAGLCGPRSWLGPLWGSAATTRTPWLRATFFPLVEPVALPLLDLVPVTKLRE